MQAFITHKPIAFGATLSFGAALLVGHTQIAQADDLPESIQLTGIVRDFHESHADMETQPDNGFGHYAGNVALFLGPDKKPVWTGQGKKVTSQWQDASGCNIAPHMVNKIYPVGPPSGEPPTSYAILKDSDGVDAYEVTFVSAEFNGDGTSTWTYHVAELPTGKDLSHWNIALAPSQEIVAGGTTPGYDYGVDGSTGVFGIKWDVAESFNAGTFKFTLTEQFVGQDSSVNVVAKGGKNHDVGDIFGPTDSVAGDGDTPYPMSVTLMDADLGDSDGSFGASDTGGVESSDTFKQWYKDTLGVNISAPLTIELVRDGDFFVFDDKIDPLYNERGGFFPIDGEMFGNSEGSPQHNFHFSFELHTSFVYDASANQKFTYIGDDDVWVYVDGKLGIDLGGVHSAVTQCLELDRMGLEDGEEYELSFFFCERHRTQSNFRIETNIPLDTVPPATISKAYD